MFRWRVLSFRVPANPINLPSSAQGGGAMKILWRFGLLLSLLAPVQAVAAQFGGLPPPPSSQPQARQLKEQVPSAEKALTEMSTPPVESEEAKAYKAFFDL